MIISTCALFVEHAYKMISLYLPKPSCNIPFFSLGPYEFFGRKITASYFITSETKEICNTNEDYSSYAFFPLSSRAQGILTLVADRKDSLPLRKMSRINANAQSADDYWKHEGDDAWMNY